MEEKGGGGPEEEPLGPPNGKSGPSMGAEPAARKRAEPRAGAGESWGGGAGGAGGRSGRSRKKERAARGGGAGEAAAPPAAAEEGVCAGHMVEAPSRQLPCPPPNAATGSRCAALLPGGPQEPPAPGAHEAGPRAPPPAAPGGAVRAAPRRAPWN